MQVLSATIAKAKSLPDTAVKRMDETLTSFVNSLGACERLLRNPIPLSYTRHAPTPEHKL